MSSRYAAARRACPDAIRDGRAAGSRCDVSSDATTVTLMEADVAQLTVLSAPSA
jgi:hypothetical protein